MIELQSFKQKAIQMGDKIIIDTEPINLPLIFYKKYGKIYIVKKGKVKNMKDLWYWEYVISYWNDVDQREEMRSGVIAAMSMIEVMEVLNSYYGEDITNVQALKPICDTAFEFERVKEDCPNFDFEINKKG